MRKSCAVIFCIIGMALFSGCVGKEDSFMITEIIFCTDEPSDRSYQQKSDSTYTQGEIIWIYLECFRCEVTMDGEAYVAQIHTILEIIDDTETCMKTESQFMEIPTTAHPIYIWLTFRIRTDALVPGTYTLSLTVEDTLSGETATSRKAFSITS